MSRVEMNHELQNIINHVKEFINSHFEMCILKMRLKSKIVILSTENLTNPIWRLNLSMQNLHITGTL